MMVTIKFQSPFKGPLITVRLDDDDIATAGAALALTRPVSAPTSAPSIIRLGSPPIEMPGGSPLINISKALRWGGVWGVALSIPGDSPSKPVSPGLEGEPSLDDLRRMLEDAERKHRELEKQTPAWYANPFSPDVTRHHAKLTEVAHWIERLKLEIDLKEWEDARALVIQQDPFRPPVFMDREIGRLRQAISEHATRSERVQGALGRIVASAASTGNETPKASASDDVPETDWESLASDGDNLAFAKAEDAFIQEANQAIVVRIDRGDPAVKIMEWFKQSLTPQIRKIDEAVDTLKRTDDERQIFHDIRNRLTVLRSTTPLFLEAGKIDAVRSICRPPDENLMSIIRHLKSKFALTTSITSEGLDRLRLSPGTDLKAFMAVIENLVNNAAEHPSPGKKVTPIAIKYYQGMIIIDDKGAGMTEEALDNLQQGVRIHDGKVVDAADDDGEHGYGSKIVQDMCDALGIEKDVDSVLGKGTTVVLALPDGMIEPDVMDVIIRNGNNDEELKEVIEALNPERRLELVGEMNVVAQKVFNQRIEQVLDMFITGKSAKMLQRQFFEIGERYRLLLDMLVAGLPTTDLRVRAAIWNGELLRTFLQPVPSP